MSLASISVMPHHIEKFDTARMQRLSAQIGMQNQALCKLPLYRHCRIEGGQRILEDHSDMASLELRELPVRELHEIDRLRSAFLVFIGEFDRAVFDDLVVGPDAHDLLHRDRLARA